MHIYVCKFLNTWHRNDKGTLEIIAKYFLCVLDIWISVCLMVGDQWHKLIFFSWFCQWGLYRLLLRILQKQNQRWNFLSFIFSTIGNNFFCVLETFLDRTEFWRKLTRMDGLDMVDRWGICVLSPLYNDNKFVLKMKEFRISLELRNWKGVMRPTRTVLKP